MGNIVNLKKNILYRNDVYAKEVRDILDKHQVISFNVMASPGGGKTSLIIKTIERLKQKFDIGVIDGDVNQLDVNKINKTGVPVVLADTHGACHLEAKLIKDSLKKLPLKDLRLLIVENVGNLVCPASFDLGTHYNIVIASVPEGDDKPYKYPKMFKGADIVILNKIDYLALEQFNLEYFKHGVTILNDKVEIFPLSCKTGSGIDRWIAWINAKLLNKKPL